MRDEGAAGFEVVSPESEVGREWGAITRRGC